MYLRDILRSKGSAVMTCQPDDTLAEVVKQLVNCNIGSLVVMEGGQMVGIITERDILRACAAGAQDWSVLRVADRMSKMPITAGPDDDVNEVMGVLTHRRIRHLPILDEGRLAGLISIGDIVKAHHDELSLENHYLKSYIQG